MDPPALRRVTLGTALGGLVLLIVVLTAALVHLPWSVTARRNVIDVAERLNGEIVGSVRQELASILANTSALAESLRSILAQGAISPEDEASREFIFISLLRSQPAVSRLSFGWPDGRFFGVQKIDGDRIDITEVRDSQLRTDRYLAQPGEVIFQERSFVPSPFAATDQAWFSDAWTTRDIAWSINGVFADGRQPSVTISTPLVLYTKPVGVVAATIAMRRLSEFLATLEIGASGSVVVLDPQGMIVASSDPAEMAMATGDRRRRLADIGAKENPQLHAVSKTLTRHQVDLAHPPPTLLDQVEAGDGAYFVNLARLGFKGWVVATAIPQQDFLARIERNTRNLLALLLLFVAGVATAAVLLARRLIVRPLQLVAGQLRHVEAFEPERMRLVPSRLRELSDLSASLMQMGQGLGSFRKYVPADLVRTLVAQGVPARPELEGRELTVLFTDLADFTSLSERLGEDIVPLLTDYLSQATRAVIETGGTVDKFIGDAVMAFWGAPTASATHALHACRAALEIRRRLGELRSRFSSAAEGLDVRIGINTGRMLVGNIGSDERLSYTVVGDAVNIASRLESLNKLYGTRIIIGAATRRACGARIVVRELDAVAVYGRAQATVIYELLGMAEEAETIEPLDWVKNYERGLAAYRSGEWAQAAADFERTRRNGDGLDPAAALLLQRSRDFTLAPPKDWRGALILDSK